MDKLLITMTFTSTSFPFLFSVSSARLTSYIERQKDRQTHFFNMHSQEPASLFSFSVSAMTHITQIDNLLPLNLDDGHFQFPIPPKIK